MSLIFPLSTKKTKFNIQSSNQKKKKKTNKKETNKQTFDSKIESKDKVTKMKIPYLEYYQQKLLLPVEFGLLQAFLVCKGTVSVEHLQQGTHLVHRLLKQSFALALH